MSKQTHSFQAEVAQLLHLVTHSLYSNPAGFDVGSGPVWCMSSLSDARKSPFKKLTANDERFALAA
jgi:hypothetical protein